MSEWIEYTGSDEQIESIKLHFAGIVWKDNHGFQLNTPLRSLIHHTPKDIKDFLDARGAKHILFCDPHPCAEIIKIWADTGCPVYIKIPSHLLLSYFYEYWDETKNYDFITATYPPVIVTTSPDWNIPGAEYSLTPFEEKS